MESLLILHPLVCILLLLYISISLHVTIIIYQKKSLHYYYLTTDQVQRKYSIVIFRTNEWFDFFPKRMIQSSRFYVFPCVLISTLEIIPSSYECVYLLQDSSDVLHFSDLRDVDVRIEQHVMLALLVVADLASDLAVLQRLVKGVRRSVGGIGGGTLETEVPAR